MKPKVCNKHGIHKAHRASATDLAREIVVRLCDHTLGLTLQRTVSVTRTYHQHAKAPPRISLGRLLENSYSPLELEIWTLSEASRSKSFHIYARLVDPRHGSGHSPPFRHQCFCWRLLHLDLRK